MFSSYLNRKCIFIAVAAFVAVPVEGLKSAKKDFAAAVPVEGLKAATAAAVSGVAVVHKSQACKCAKMKFNAKKQIDVECFS